MNFFFRSNLLIVIKNMNDYYHNAIISKKKNHNAIRHNKNKYIDKYVKNNFFFLGNKYVKIDLDVNYETNALTYRLLTS